jgi:predicted CxxxxCH...CXXCH cytochrome family protein
MTSWHRVGAWLSAAASVLLFTACGPQERPGEEVAASAPEALTADHVLATGAACVPTGAHAKHGLVTSCTTCHACAGTLQFASPGPAVGAGQPAPTFDATAKTCSNVACHAVTSGTYTYSVWDWGADDLVWVSVPYGGAGGGGPVNWYAAPGTGGCSACHGYPPAYNGTRYAWHSGMHGINISNGNACQLCHPDATGAFVYGPTYVPTSAGLITSCPSGTYCSAPGTIINASMHGNGVMDVSAAFRSACLGCH